MQLNSEIIISDTSCLILLSKIDELALLNKLGRKVFITQIISREFGQKLPDFIKVMDPSDTHYQKILEMDLDEGEASAIALSFELSNSILILDELKGRRIAEKLQLRYSGTIGLILRAKQEGIISAIKPILTKMRGTNFRFSERLLDTILELAGE
ncbi:MAG TPA: DUF3368 domain-containing protein [Bacteroidetes bacterium]|nr:DUF3368 domain-containing protein [Bacteroidota bacterium]